MGFEEIRARFEIDAPDASDGDLDALMRWKTERYCVVLQTLEGRPKLTTELARA